MARSGARQPWYRGLIVLYDRLYCTRHGLDRPESQVGPALRVSVRRCRRGVALADGTVISRGDPIGVLHLNNDRVGGIHAEGRATAARGVEFRRQFLASLAELTRLAAAPGPLSHVGAFTATTIFLGLRRLGFEPEPGSRGSILVAIYQRALVAALHPAVGRRRARHDPAERLWISREALLTRFATPRPQISRRIRVNARSLSE